MQPNEKQPSYLHMQWEESAQELAYTPLIQQQFDLERPNHLGTYGGQRRKQIQQ